MMVIFNTVSWVAKFDFHCPYLLQNFYLFGPTGQRYIMKKNTTTCILTTFHKLSELITENKV